MNISVIIPAKNESKDLPYVLNKMPKETNEIILIDGKSSNDTIKVAKEIFPSSRILHQKGSIGKGSALQEGFESAIGDIIIAIEANESMDTCEIPRFVEKIKEGYDLVKESRFLDYYYTEDMTSIRKIENQFIVSVVNSLYKRKYIDFINEKKRNVF